MVNRITEHIDIWTAAQTPKSNGAGRGNGSARHGLHGIKKLRELILELAVRGKLVSQDSTDEPASDLLKKITREKVRLIKEGKIKKDKPLPVISEDEKPFDLPEGWEWTRMGEVVEIVRGITFPANEKSKLPEQGRVACLRTTNVQDKIEWDDLLYIREKYVKREDQFVRHSDIVMSMANSRELVGKVAIIEEEPKFKTSFGGFLSVLRPILLCPKYLMTLLRVPTYNNILIGSASQTTNIANISLGKLNPLVLAIPPFAEQHRIVAKVDELMALCDQMEQQQIESSDTHQILVETLLATLTNAADQKECAGAWQRIANHFDILFTTEQSIDQLKQTILQLAVMGKLVPQDANDLPAPRPGKWFVYVLECEDGSLYKGHSQDILKRWKQHASGEGSEWTKKHPPKRLVHWEAFNSQEEAVAREKELKSGYGRKWLEREIKAGRTRQAGLPASDLLKKIAKEKARLIKEGKIKKQKPLPEISEDEKPFELPKGWEWSQLQEVLDVRDGTHDSPKDSTGSNTYPLVTSKNFYNGKIKFDEARRISAEDHYNISKRSNVERHDILFSMIGGNLGNQVMVDDDRPFSVKNVALFKYYNRELTSPCFIKKFLEHLALDLQSKAAGGAQPFVSLSFLRNLVIAVPPINEQHRIVAKVDELMAICDALRAMLNEAQTTQVQLADAIVEQAVA